MTSRMTIARVVIGGWVCLIAPVALADPTAAPAQAPTPWPTSGWQVATPEDEGMSSGALARLVESVGAFQHDSLLVVRHGKIVLDVAYAPYQAGIRHDLRSVTKSIIGTLTGIEVQQGLLDSIDHPIVDLFADKQIAGIDDNKKAMTVKSLLDMTSGVEWQEHAYTPDESISRMYETPDRAAFVLNQPMANPPGSHFQYNGGNPYVLSALITKLTGRSALDFAKAELFGPLGITDVRWGHVDALGISDGESGLYMTPRDMAKIGFLYLHDGVWDGRTIIPPWWVQQAREGKVVATYGFHYANFWWSFPEKDAFMALGRHSQIILVLPKLDIVAVTTGHLPDGLFYPEAQFVDALAGASRSTEPLPADPVAQSVLEDAIRVAGQGQPYAVGLTPDLAREISGKTIHLADNRMHLKTFTLNLVDPQPSWEITTQKDDEAAEPFSGPVGLDGRFRTSPPASYGVNAVRGRWLGARTFEMERRILGRSADQRWTFAFAGKSVDLLFESTDGRRADMHGDLGE